MIEFFFHGIERIVILGGAIFFGYLGYRLYGEGSKHGKSEFSGKSRLLAITMSGQGPPGKVGGSPT